MLRRAPSLTSIAPRRPSSRPSGTTRKVTVREGILTGFAQAGLKGDTKSANFLLKFYDGPQEGQASAVTGEEHEILAAYAEAYLKNRGAD